MYNDCRRKKSRKKLQKNSSYIFDLQKVKESGKDRKRPFPLNFLYALLQIAADIAKLHDIFKKIVQLVCFGLQTKSKELQLYNVYVIIYYETL